MPFALKKATYLKWDAISQSGVGASHHSQDPGYLAGRHLSPPILDDYVSAFIQTEGKNVENRSVLTDIHDR